MRTGDVIDGRYELADARGSGSGGVVWTAFDRKLKRTVALKRPHGVANESDRVQFRREAETAAQVHHPNAISVFDTVDADECWLVMEYLSAESLDKVLAAGPLPPDRVARIGVQIAGALAAVHARKIVHRDVKPGNILVTGDDLAKLTDFGISIWRAVTLTDDGKISGTPAFAAPEVAGGQPANEASDVFSLGATLFAALEGTPPFGSGEAHEVLERVRQDDMLPMRHTGPLAELVSEMLERRPRKRPTAEQVWQRLKEIVGQWEPPTVPNQVARQPYWRRPRNLVGAAVLLVVAIAGGAFLIGMDPPQAGQAPPVTGLIGDERTADPCAPLAGHELGQFGPTQLETTYGNFNRCDVLIDVGVQNPVDVEVQLVTRESTPTKGEPFTVAEGLMSRDECDRTVLADDKHAVRVTAKLKNPPVNLCQVADVAVDNVKTVLGRGQLARRASPFPSSSLAHVRACQLLDSEALAAIPGVDASSGVNVFGDWACKWFSTVGGPGINLRYDQHASSERIKGEPIVLGNHNAFVKLDTDTSTSCTVSVLHQPPNAAPQATVDVLVLTVRGDRDGSEYCGQATTLAKAAAAKLSR